VVAVDDGSSDGSPEVLERALGAERVVRIPQSVGFPAALARGLEVPGVKRADYVLFLHDDAALAPTAVAHLLKAAREVEEAGIVGPKVRDWEKPDVLRELGGSADRFGSPFSAIEEGEVDHGQYDTRLEVLAVSFTAMLVSRAVLERIGFPDERMRTADGALDFCWQARMSGFRVVVEPRAIALHREAGERGERQVPRGRPRYLRERAGLAGLLKNYRLVTLLWLLPAFFVQGLARIIVFALSRRGEAADILRAWGWNITHLPGTIRRRVRVQAVRRLPDREVARYMTSAGARIRRWALDASSVLIGERTGPIELEEEAVVPPLRERIGEFLARHPVGLAWGGGILVALVGFRHVLGASPLSGGMLPTFPDRAVDFFQEFVSGWSSAGLGGPGEASPALAVLGLGSVLTLGNPHLLARLIVAVGPLVAAVVCYRAVYPKLQDARAAVVAAASYALSALPLWAVSEGRVGAIVFLAAAPWLVVRLWEGFDRTPMPSLRRVVAVGVVIGLVGSFVPGVWLAVALAGLLGPLVPGRGWSRLRGLGMTFGAGIVGAVLAYPVVIGIVRAGRIPVEAAGLPSVWSLLRLAPGPAPGSWPVAFFLPLAGVVAFVIAGEEDAGWSWRALMAAAVSPLLAWLSAGGRLFGAPGDSIAFLGVGAVSLSLLVGFAVRGLIRMGVGRHAFGYRQVAFVSLALILGVGLSLQALQATRGAWAVGQAKEPPAWPVVETAYPGRPFRVLWLGQPRAMAFPPPGGTPDGVVAVGATSVSYGITGKLGKSVLSTGLPPGGPGFHRLERVLGSVLAGRLRHAGSLLAPFGVRFVVSAEGGLPETAARSLSAQVDLDLIQEAGGLRIYENPRAYPLAAGFEGEGPVTQARSIEVLAPARIFTSPGSLHREANGRWAGRVSLAEGGLVYVSTAFDPGWRLSGAGRPFPAFGWAVGFEAPAGTTEAVAEYGGQTFRILELLLLAALWAGALTIALRRGRRPTGVSAVPMSGPVEAPEAGGKEVVAG
jgi:GT2 family glycosyltransferase